MAGGFFFVDTPRCTACRGCQVACKAWHKLPGVKTRQWGSPQNPKDLGPDTYRLVRFREYNQKDKAVRDYFSDACRHCLDPPCKDAADQYVKGAVVIDRSGAVIHTEKTALLGENAEEVMVACPFNIPRKDPGTGILRKCNMCFDRLKAGLEPSCAKACPVGAINFGSEKSVMALAQSRLATAKRLYGHTAQLLNADEVRVIYLIADEAEKYYEFATY
jgi:formate dehydrogenase iron-sulfur subunit